MILSVARLKAKINKLHPVFQFLITLLSQTNQAFNRFLPMLSEPNIKYKF